MLVHAAELLRANLTKDDFVARVGGDEFIVVCVYDGPATRLDKIARAIVHAAGHTDPRQPGALLLGS